MARRVPRHLRRGFSASVAANPWQDSTHAEAAWERSRSAGPRWAIAGVVLGVLVGLLVFAPAAWLAQAVAAGTGQRVLLTETRGTVWSGSAVLVLTGGVGSRDATALPGRFEWSVGLRGLRPEVRMRHACCLNGTVTLQVQPGWGRFSVTLMPTPEGWVGQWPSALLTGLGTPWNTLKLGGALRLSTSGINVEWVQGRVLINGRADLELAGASSRISTLSTLGSYRVSIVGDSKRNEDPTQITLSTTEGALQISGTGSWGPRGLRFRGEAKAAEANAQALTNLLNIIGRRDGARSVISIG
jgi:general secretion pathway protein N